MTELRAIDVSDYAPLKPPETFGAAPQLQWLQIALLVVDDSYQREITDEGRTKVRRIAAEFDWDRFAPVVVAPIVGGRYAIVDGQHRTTSAQLAGFDSVPCSIILADRRKQAIAFDAINGNVTRVTPAQRFRAMVAAGDVEALRIDAVCSRAGVRVRVSNAKRRADILPGDTFAFAAIRTSVLKYGDDTVETALRCIVTSADGEGGWLSATPIRAISAALHDHPEWLKSRRLLAAFRVFNVDQAARAAAAESQTRKGVVAADILRGKVVTFLMEFLEGGRTVALAAPKAAVAVPAPEAVAAAPAEGLRIGLHDFSPAEAALIEALLEKAFLTRGRILAATRDCPLALDAREESAADDLVRDLRRKIGRLGVPIVHRNNGYLIELPAKTRLRGLIARARAEAAE